jgi:hypothetical protein
MYLDIVCVLYVNPICVRALSWWFDAKHLYNNILTVIKPEMELGTVLHSESLDCQIGAREKPNSLH